MKAVALGAEGVGLGRAVLYSYAAYGQAGQPRQRILQERSLRH